MQQTRSFISDLMGCSLLHTEFPLSRMNVNQGQAVPLNHRFYGERAPRGHQAGGDTTAAQDFRHAETGGMEIWEPGSSGLDPLPAV